MSKSKKRREKPWRSAAVPACCCCSSRHWSTARQDPPRPACCMPNPRSLSVPQHPLLDVALLFLSALTGLYRPLELLPDQDDISHAVFETPRSTGSATIHGGQTSLNLAPRPALLHFPISFFVCTYQIYISRHILVEIGGWPHSSPLSQPLVVGCQPFVPQASKKKVPCSKKKYQRPLKTNNPCHASWLDLEVGENKALSLVTYLRIPHHHPSLWS